MPGSINKAILIGRVGADPKIVATGTGNRLANFSIATSETWKNKNGEPQKRTSWHNIAVFSEPLVKLCEAHVRKGDLIAVEGSIKTRKWQDQTGADRYTTEIVLQGFADRLTLLGSASQSRTPVEATQKPADGQTGSSGYQDTLADQIPF